MENQNAPYAVTSLVMGICSLVFGCFFVGLVFGIIGTVLASKGQKAVAANPSVYSGTGMFVAGKVLSIIGIVASSIYIVYYIIAVAILGSVGLAWWNVFGNM